MGQFSTPQVGQFYFATHNKTEVIRKRGPWRNLDAVEYATLEWVDWFNNRRLLEPIGHVPPAEFEQIYYRDQEAQAA